MDPYQGEWHFNLGLTLEASGRYEDAIGAFGEAQKLSPDDPQSSYMIGVNHLPLNQPVGRIKWLEKTVKLDPAHVDANVHRIEAYARMGQHEQAELVFSRPSRRIRTIPTFMPRWRIRCWTGGCTSERCGACTRRRGLIRTCRAFRARLAEAYAATGRHERARQLYRICRTAAQSG